MVAGIVLDLQQFFKARPGLAVGQRLQSRVRVEVERGDLVDVGAGDPAAALQVALAAQLFDMGEQAHGLRAGTRARARVVADLDELRAQALVVGHLAHQVEGQLVAHAGQVVGVLVQVQRVLALPVRTLVELDAVGLERGQARAAAAQAHLGGGALEQAIAACGQHLDLGLAVVGLVLVQVYRVQRDHAAGVARWRAGQLRAGVLVHQIQASAGNGGALVAQVQRQQLGRRIRVEALGLRQVAGAGGEWGLALRRLWLGLRCGRRGRSFLAATAAGRQGQAGAQQGQAEPGTGEMGHGLYLRAAWRGDGYVFQLVAPNSSPSSRARCSAASSARMKRWAMSSASMDSMAACVVPPLLVTR